MTTLKRGVLISIEGIDGSGKSTLAKKIKELFDHENIETVLTREPGDSALGKHLRKILQERDFDMCGKSEFLLFASDRAQHFQDVIIPNLEKNKIVISDRMGDSSVVYQGYGRGEDIQMIQTINNWTMQNRHPDLILHIQISMDVAMKRLQKRETTPTTFESETQEYTEKLIKGFKQLYKDKHNVILLDGKQSADQIAQTAYQHITQWIKDNDIAE